MHTFQKLLTTLTDFWASRGCIVHQGYDIEVGAGTFNPATFFRCLGPEPYQTVYIEPSRRPQDGRYAENPNRLQLFHQLQVVMKPSPMNIQSLFLESLEAIGFNLSQHDVRFVHDDWESPTLGAWGLGWEVWIDGMEITQFTYFQAMASRELAPISVELTYGLERLAMILQDKSSFFEMMWNETYSYADVVKQNEIEWSTYNFEAASTTMWLQHFTDYESEAVQLVERGLAIPAYDFVNKASHAFNILEARGVLSTTERTGYISRVRDLSRQVAESYLASRERLGFPLLKQPQTTAKPTPSQENAPSWDAERRADYVLEIGCEELPADYIDNALEDLHNRFRDLLTKHRLEYSRITTYGTPRRLAAYITDLVEGAPDETIEQKGPPLSIVFDAKGELTPQGAGFLRTLNLSTVQRSDIESGKHPQLFLREHKGQTYLFGAISKKGRATATIFSEEMPNMIQQLHFPKKMRWHTYDFSFARPIHSLLSLHGDRTLPFTAAACRADNITHGHPQKAPGAFAITHAEAYLETLRSHYVLASVEERRKAIETQLNTIEGYEVLAKERLIKEVVHLTEWPEIAVAHFDARFLEIPEEVLTSEMVEHQKYFPLAHNGRLTNKYVITADTTPTDDIIQGNTNVLTARLSDGAFLFRQDLKHTLDYYLEKLNTVIFHKKLGTLYDKTERIIALATHIQSALNMSSPESAARAARYCKADLTSELTQEFPDLQGIIGKYYAREHGFPEEVALALEEHWMPRSEKAPLPQSETGIIVSLADKIDNLCSYFSIGLAPTSSSDPYALRRGTLGLLRILIEHHLSLNLPQALAVGCHKLNANDTCAADILSFITMRAKTVFLQYGLKKDEIEAALDTCTDPYDQYLRVQALHDFRGSEVFAHLYEVYKRARGQLSGQTNHLFEPRRLQEAAEKQLYDKLIEQDAEYQSALRQGNYPLAYTKLAELQPYLAQLFDTVQILHDDADLRSNRIALLQTVFDKFAQLLDFSKIQA